MTSPSHDSAASPDRWAARLVRLMQEQVALACRLDQLSRRQSAEVARSEPEAVLATLAERDPVVARMATIAAELEPFLRAPSGGGAAPVAALDGSARREIDALLTELETLVDTVNRRDTADQMALERHRREVAAELAGVASARGAVAAYGGRDRPLGPVMQDREG